MAQNRTSTAPLIQQENGARQRQVTDSGTMEQCVEGGNEVATSKQPVDPFVAHHARQIHDRERRRWVSMGRYSTAQRRSQPGQRDHAYRPRRCGTISNWTAALLIQPTVRYLVPDDRCTRLRPNLVAIVVSSRPTPRYTGPSPATVGSADLTGT
jgi:hypothetical protein